MEARTTGKDQTVINHSSEAGVVGKVAISHSRKAKTFKYGLNALWVPIPTWCRSEWWYSARGRTPILSTQN